MMNTKKEITINIFHDERLLQKEKWLYHGMLFVPSSSERWLINELARFRGEYDGFVHFSELHNPSSNTAEGKKTATAKKWIQFLLQDTRFTRQVGEHNNFCALVLGVNLKNLNRDCFGSGADQNIYNRFFRTTLISGIRRFYSSDFEVVRVGRVFHGTQTMRGDNPLRWHPMWRIERDTFGDVVFDEPKLTTIAADHRRERLWPQQSHLIQFTDTIIGSFSQCLDFSSTKRGCIEVAEELLPLVERLTKQPNNVNSKYFRKYGLNFFPSKLLTLEDLQSIEKHSSGFYTERMLNIRERRQSRLFPK